MKKYPDDQSNIDWKTFPFTKFRIVAKTEKDKKELLAAFYHIHNSSIDTDYVTVNQLAHIYQDTIGSEGRIIVDKELYESLVELNNQGVADK